MSWLRNRPSTCRSPLRLIQSSREPGRRDRCRTRMRKRDGLTLEGGSVQNRHTSSGRHWVAAGTRGRRRSAARSREDCRSSARRISLMEPLYKPEGVEERWQRTWEEEGLYNAEADDPRETFVICLPPPNVTDRLHMGHALNASCQDVLVRWHRMRSFNTLWQPGYDHASIALQAVMTRRLAEEGLTLQDVGREAFVERCRAFVRDY